VAAEPVLVVEGLRVSFDTDAGPVRAVDGVTWSVGAGETLGIVGESGSGKSVSALAVMGLVPAPPGRVEAGRVQFEGRDLLGLGERELRRVRGREIAMIFQDPLTSLNPMFTVGAQIAEAVRAHERVSRLAARARAISLLGEVGIASPRDRAREYPHQFSGGMRQRAIIAMALAGSPRVLLADEPTTALDVTVQAQILELLARLRHERGMAVVLITHDLAVVAGQADRVLVMYGGRPAEMGRAEDVFYRTSHGYSLGLLETAASLDRGRRRGLVPIGGQAPSLLHLPEGCAFHPRCRFATPACATEVPVMAATNGHAAACHEAGVLRRLSRLPAVREVAATDAADAPPDDNEPPLLQVVDVVKLFPGPRQAILGPPRATARAVDGVSLDVAAGRTFAVVGESGCGKSTLARLILRLVEPTSGTVRFAGEDVTAAGPARLRQLRRQMQFVFQDPLASLDPRMNVAKVLREPFLIHGEDAGDQEVRRLLDAVGLPAELARRFPHELSGGERQRVGIARAIALAPRLVVCDEPVSSLDASIQAQVLRLLLDLQRQRDIAYVLIAHDLRVVRQVADRVAVMYLGRIVEAASVDDVFARPRHPYTQALMSAVPIPDPRREQARQRIVLEGEVPSPADRPRGCRFRSRCPLFARELGEADRQRCMDDVPAFADGVACHFPAARVG
jgi:peptide/nickel transport system ATP-binding protein